MAMIGKGGSSSAFATTVIRSKEGRDMESSATGRIGVSLLQLLAVKKVSFTFRWEGYASTVVLLALVGNVCGAFSLLDSKIHLTSRSYMLTYHSQAI
jgi:hypothetical protein